MDAWHTRSSCNPSASNIFVTWQLCHKMPLIPDNSFEKQVLQRLEILEYHVGLKPTNAHTVPPTAPKTVHHQTDAHWSSIFSPFDSTLQPRDDTCRVVQDDHDSQCSMSFKDMEMKDYSLFCDFHKDYGHDTRDCRTLRDELDRMAMDDMQWSLQFKHIKSTHRQRNKSRQQRRRACLPHNKSAPAITIYTITGNHPATEEDNRKRKHCDDDYQPTGVKQLRNKSTGQPAISFDSSDYGDVCFPHTDAIILTLRMTLADGAFAYNVARVLIDTGRSVSVLYKSTFLKFGLSKEMLILTHTSITTLLGDSVHTAGTIILKVRFGSFPCQITIPVEFLVINIPSTYNAILGRAALNKLGAVVSTSHLMIKFNTDRGVGCEHGDQLVSRTCYAITVHGSAKTGNNIAPGDEPLRQAAEPVEKIEPFEVSPGRFVQVGTMLTPQQRDELCTFLQKNKDVFAWSTNDMPASIEASPNIAYLSCRAPNQFNKGKDDWGQNDRRL